MDDSSNVMLDTKDCNSTTFENKITKEKLLKALKEVEDIEKGKINATRYNCFDDVLKDLDLKDM